jgi:hypothetical protein
MSSELTLDEFDGSNCVDRVVSFGGNAAVAGKIGIDRSDTELAASACELWQRLHCIYHRQPNVMVACAQAHVAQAMDCIVVLYGLYSYIIV